MVWLKDFLSNNLDIFAWSPTNMPGVNASIICHQLSIDPEIKPVKQKVRKMNAEWCQALIKEVYSKPTSSR